MELDLTNVQSEMLVIGSFFKDPTLYLTYSNSIVPKYDFSDKACEFFWELFADYYVSYSEDFSELKLNTFASMLPERFKEYRANGGYKTIKSFMELADPKDFKNYFETLKKYSLLRAFNSTGYDVSKILSLKNFQSLTSNDICRIVRGRIDKVANKVQAIDEPSVLSDNAVNYMIYLSSIYMDDLSDMSEEMFRADIDSISIRICKENKNVRFVFSNKLNKENVYIIPITNDDYRLDPCIPMGLYPNMNKDNPKLLPRETSDWSKLFVRNNITRGLDRNGFTKNN